MEAYHFKRIEPDNLADLVFLVKKVAKKQLSTDYYRKKYSTPWAAGRYHGWLAYDAQTGQVVSVAAALPLRAEFPDGRQVPLTQMIETFTLPEHRGKGLMTFMVNKILAEHKEQGTPLFFGLLNQNNVHGFVKKLGFTFTGKMVRFQLKISTFPLEALCRRMGVPGLYQRWANRVLAPFFAPPDAPPLPNSVVREGNTGVLHDEQFFKYKSFTFNRLCRFAGIDTWLKFESGLLVGDVGLPDHCPDAQFDEWLATLQVIARRAGLKQIIFQTHPQSQLGRMLAARYEAKSSWAVCCLATNDEWQPLLDTMRFGYGDFETF